jgi:microcystin-dependent protein
MASDPFIAEIALYSFNFEPRGWALCNGQILSISQNTALFSLIGTMYGGNGQTTFALPNLQGKCVIAPGQGPGLSYRNIAEVGGSVSVSLTALQIPSHTHSVQTTLKTANPSSPTDVTANPIDNFPAASTVNLYSDTAGAGTMTPLNVDVQVASAGGSLPHNNMQPYLTINFCIALQGLYPARP